MTTDVMIANAAATMQLAAKAFADKGMKTYSVDAHCAAAGLALSKAGASDPKEIAALFHSLYNHSAWRQKFEKAGIFAAQAKRASTLDDLMGQLDSEGV